MYFIEPSREVFFFNPPVSHKGQKRIPVPDCTLADVFQHRAQRMGTATVF